MSCHKINAQIIRDNKIDYTDYISLSLSLLECISVNIISTEEVSQFQYPQMINFVNISVDMKSLKKWKNMARYS